MKQWLTYFCILLFSLQVMPIQEIGTVLINGQIAEEKNYSCGDATEDGASKGKKHPGDPLYTNEKEQSNARMQCFSRLMRMALVHAACRSQAFDVDILTPPPDYS